MGARASILGLSDIPIGELQNLTREQRAFLIETFIQVEDPDTGRMVPLVPNQMQRDIIMSLTDYEITVKWRRAGLTSIYVADAWIDLITRPSVNVELFAHNDKTAREIFDQVVVRQYESIPEEIRPVADRSTVNSLVFKDLGSKFVVRTAGQSIRTAEAAGQGRTVNILLCTEFAFYAYPEHFLSKIENCIPKVGGKIRIDSTPNGQNSFWSRFVSARNNDSRFHARFYPWWWSDRCTLPLDDGETEDDLHGGGPITEAEAALGVGNPFADDRRGQDALTPEQIKWRRWKIADIKPLGALTPVDRFRTEFPEDPDSCFLHSGRPLFMASDLQQRAELCEPEAGHEYVIGHDTSTGSASGHPAGTVIIDISSDPPRQVYEWIGWEPTDSQAERLVDLQSRYNDAWIVVERNYPGDSVLTLLRRWGTPYVYRHQDKELREHVGTVHTRKPGFPMSAQTKPRVFTDLQASLSRGELLLAGALTISDLKGMQYDDDDRIVYEADRASDQVRGMHTHGELAVACAIAWHGRKSGGPGMA